MLQVVKCLSPGHTAGQCRHWEGNPRRAVRRVHAPSSVTPEAGSEVGEPGLRALSVATHESQGGRGESHSPRHEHTAPAVSTPPPP